MFLGYYDYGFYLYPKFAKITLGTFVGDTLLVPNILQPKLSHYQHVSI